MKETREMKGNLNEIKRIRADLKEAGDMIASDPKQPVNPSLFELILRELDKLNRLKRIDPMLYSRAIVMAKSRIIQLNNIYSKNGRDLQGVIMFLLRLAHTRAL
jgi:hypothetical protein